ncbi:hypothetical protein KI387_043050, partial [Taxus chinensis]
SPSRSSLKQMGRMSVLSGLLLLFSAACILTALPTDATYPTTPTKPKPPVV